MNYIREAETVLKHYQDLYQSIENMNEQICQLTLKGCPKHITAVMQDEVGIRTGRHDDTINVLFEIQTLNENKLKTQEELDKVNAILDGLSKESGCELYKVVLWKWYIERVPKEDIAEQIGYSSRQSIYGVRNLAIRKFAIRLFGIEALKVV